MQSGIFGASGLPLTGGTITGPLIANNNGGGNAATVRGAATGGYVQIGIDASSVDANPPGYVVLIKGTSAIIARTGAPDGTAANGNAPGAGATDWQRTRANATQVASGTAATIIGGINNTASAANSTAGGQSSTASGGQSVAIGDNTTASGTSATAFGAFNAADNSYSWIPGGLRTQIRGIYGKGAWASGMFVAPGDAQAGEQVLRAAGTSATAVALTSNGTAAGATNLVNLPNNSTFRVTFSVVARQTGGAAGTVGDSAGWGGSVLVKRGANAAATSVVGGGGAALAPTENDAAAAAWRLAVAADTTTGAVGFTGTGEASKNIQWVVRIMSAENVG